MIPSIVVLLTLAAVACFGRVIAGPTLPDKIAAVDQPRLAEKRILRHGFVGG